MDINTVILIGRLTKDADLSYTGGGSAIMNFSIAVDHMKKKDGSADTSFFNCKAFGKLAENLSKYLVKGKQVGVKGYLKQDRWEKDGQKQSRISINCDEIELLGGNSQTSSGNGSGYGEGGYGSNGYNPSWGN
jgi:single-strand DNA-binding protein